MDNNDHPVTKKELTEIIDGKFKDWSQHELSDILDEKLDKWSHNGLGEVFDEKLNTWTHDSIAEVVESMFEKHQDKIVDEVKKIKDEIVKSNDNLAGVIKKDHEELAAKFMTAKQAEEKLEKFGNTLAEHGNFLSTLGFQPA